MKNIIILFAITLMFSSCSSIYFEEPQPKNAKDLSEIPDELIGEYSFLVLNSEKTMKITKNMIYSDDTTTLNDDMLLRKIDEYYVFNKKLTDKDESVNGYWEIYLLKPNDCGNIKSIMFSILKDDENEEIVPDFVKKYNATVIQTEGVMGKTDTYIINPSEKDFLELINNKDVTVRIILENIENQ